MINYQLINEWLESNKIPPIIDHFLLVTPNGKLLSYPDPQNVQNFNNELALISQCWENFAEATATNLINNSGKILDDELKVLTMELKLGNIIVRAVQPNLLLVLIGFNFKPNPKDDYQKCYHAEYHGEHTKRYPSPDECPTTISFVDDEVPADTTTTNTTTTTTTENEEPEEENAADAKVDGGQKEHALGILHFQRTRLDVMVSQLQHELSSRNFIMKV